MVFGNIYQMYHHHHNNSRSSKEEINSESMSINHQSELLSKSLCSSSSDHSKEKENNFSRNLYVVYVLVGILYLSTIAIALICVCYANRLNDLSMLRENLKNEFIVTDIKHIVQMVLKDMKNEHQPMYKLSER